MPQARLPRTVHPLFPPCLPVATLQYAKTGAPGGAAADSAAHAVAEAVGYRLDDFGSVGSVSANDLLAVYHAGAALHSRCACLSGRDTVCVSAHSTC